MINEQIIQQELDSLENLTYVVEAYETAASTSVRRIRNAVLTNREFHIGLNRIFQEIVSAYKKEVERIMKQKKITQSSAEAFFMKRTKQTVLVLLSANTGLYGNVIHRIFSAFLTEVKRTKADVVIVGRMGKIFFQDAMPGSPFTYFDFPDNAIAIANLKLISTFLVQYEKIVTFYALFKSLMVQQVRASVISGSELPTEQSSHTIPPSYLFEPSLEEIVLFFENEIFASLLEQVFQESRLAKLAARMVLLDQTLFNIERTITRTTEEQQRMYHRALNYELINSLSGVSLWN